MTENVLTRGFAEVNFTDQYGEDRIIYRQKGHALRVKKRKDSVSHVLNRAAAEIMGARIREKRMERGLTLDELLAKAGLGAGPGQGKQRMWEIETAGKGRGGSYKQFQGIRFGTLYALALALECEPAELLPSAQEVAAKARVALLKPSEQRVTRHDGLVG